MLVVDAAEDSEWVSWAEAARLTGLPVHRVEWWKRQGRIEHRAEDKMRPTLRRSSVEEFGRWYRDREDDRRERHEAKLATRRAAQTPPRPMGYVTTAEATATTGLSSKTVLRRLSRSEHFASAGAGGSLRTPSTRSSASCARRR